MCLRSIVSILTTCICMSLLAGRVLADPLPGETLKFIQMPLNGGLPVPIALPSGAVSGAPAPFPGHDELSTAYQSQTVPPAPVLSGTFMADDFSDKLNTPVVHVQWWGSYMNQSVTTSGPVKQFLISFESDVPAGPAGNFSHPGTPIESEVVSAGALASGSGTFTETPVPAPATSPDGNLFQYNAELAVPFKEQANTVYWLKIVALDPNHVSSTQPGAIQWGWHDRDWGLQDNLAAGPPVPTPGEFNEAPAGIGPIWHFQDDAVSGSVVITLPTSGGLPLVDQSNFAPTNYLPGIDVPTTSTELFSKDLAFALYTVPEPSTFVLLGVGALARPRAEVASPRLRRVGTI